MATTTTTKVTWAAVAASLISLITAATQWFEADREARKAQAGVVRVAEASNANGETLNSLSLRLARIEGQLVVLRNRDVVGKPAWEPSPSPGDADGTPVDNLLPAPAGKAQQVEVDALFRD